MNTKNKLGIHFAELNPKEIALFERVISFNVTHGLEATVEANIDDANLVISSAESFDSLELSSDDKTVVVIANDETTTQGDLQLCRPLMITKVMGALTEAVKLNEEKQNAIAKVDSADLVDVSIEEASFDDEVFDIETYSTMPAVKPISTPKAIVEVAAVIEDEKPVHHALIIDDSAAIRKQLELELRDAGITSAFAECGEDALEIISNNHFDLIFLDIIMPGIDGYETCQAMRSNLAYKKTPIIMLSGKTSPLDEVKGVIAGATTYLTKPVKSDKLQETLNRVTKWIENYAPPKQTETA